MSNMAAREIVEQQQLHDVFEKSDKQEAFFGLDNPGGIPDIAFKGLTSESDDEETQESDKNDGDRLHVSEPWTYFWPMSKLKTLFSPAGPTFKPPKTPGRGRVKFGGPETRMFANVYTWYPHGHTYTMTNFQTLNTFMT